MIAIKKFKLFTDYQRRLNVVGWSWAFCWFIPEPKSLYGTVKADKCYWHKNVLKPHIHGKEISWGWPGWWDECDLVSFFFCNIIIATWSRDPLNNNDQSQTRSCSPQPWSARKVALSLIHWLVVSENTLTWKFTLYILIFVFPKIIVNIRQISSYLIKLKLHSNLHSIHQVFVFCFNRRMFQFFSRHFPLSVFIFWTIFLCQLFTCLYYSFCVTITIQTNKPTAWICTIHQNLL